MPTKEPVNVKQPTPVARYLSATVGERPRSSDEGYRPSPSVVGDIMTRSVVSVQEQTPFKEIASILHRYRLNALPVVDADNHVLGMVTVSDLLVRVSGVAVPSPSGHLGQNRARARRKERAMIASGLMSAPATTTTAQASLAAASRLAAQARVRVLPIVDDDGVLIGIVTRSDFLRLFLRDDADIRHDVTLDVVRPTVLAGNNVQAELEDGVVTLRGRVFSARDARRLVRSTRRIGGVVDVVDDLDFELGDGFLPTY